MKRFIVAIRAKLPAGNIFFASEPISESQAKALVRLLEFFPIFDVQVRELDEEPRRWD